MSISDSQILQCIRAGNDDRVLSHLYEEVRPKVIRLIRKNQGDEAAAKDIFQDAVLVFYRQVKLNKFNEKYPIAGFIYTVSKNLWINRVKREKRSIDIPEDNLFISMEESPEEDLITKERAIHLENLLSKLGNRCHQLLSLSIFDNLSMKDICKKMGFSTENAVKTRKYKCKQKLIHLMDEDPEITSFLKV